MTRTVPQRLLIAAATLTLLAAAGVVCGARGDARVRTLIQRGLTAVPGKEIVLLEVEYLPGGASLPHRHDADVVGYVLAGRIRTQVTGQPERIVGPGETFAESPDDVHVVSANASTTEPAKFLAFFVKDEGKPLSRPAPRGPSGGVSP